MILTLREWETREGVVLDDREVRALVGSKMVEVRPHQPASGSWSLKAHSSVGVLVVDDLELRIRPKVPVPRLLELLCESIGRVEWHETDTLWATTDDLLSVVAGSFCRQVDRAMAQGVLQGYQSVQDTIFGVKGRIDLAAQMGRRAGLSLPVEVTYDEYTIDIVENRLLAGAARQLLKDQGLPVMLSTRLRRLLAVLADVEPSRPQPNPPEPTFTRLNERYRPAVTLARLVLRASSIEEEPDRTVRGAGLLVDMNKVFEDVVGNGMRSAAPPEVAVVRLQYEDRLDADGRLKRITPDVVWLHDGRVVAVADVKYKRPSSDGVDNSDIYQVLAYASRYGLSEIHLIYAETPPYESLQVADTTILLHHVDLDSDRPERGQQFAALSSTILGEPSQPMSATPPRTT